MKCGVLTVEGISTVKIVRFRTSITKLHIRENCIVVLPVNILTGVMHRLLGPHDTLPCVLILYIIFLSKSLIDLDCHQMVTNSSEPSPILSDSPMTCCAGMGLSCLDASGVCIECGETGTVCMY